MLIRSVFAAILAVASLSAQAAPVVPKYDLFGPLSGATYGGNGIPTDPSAVTTFDLVHNQVTSTVTLGLTAHRRYSNPALTNNGSGTFFATPGSNDGLVSGSPHLEAATWNFGFYINVNDAGESLNAIVSGGLLTFTLLYDTDPGTGTDLAEFGRIEFNTGLLGAFALFTTDPSNPLALDPSIPLRTLQGSENLDFDFLNDGTGPVVFQPTYGPGFDASANGEYGFVLRAVDENAVAHESAILVNVAAPGSTVPEPGTLALVGLALAGVGVMRKGRKA